MRTISAALALVLLFSICAFADPARTFYYEQDFITDPTLVALPNQVSVLTLSPASGTTPPLQQHKVRYQLSSGSYNFCLKGDPSLTTMTVTDPSGQAVVNLDLNACSTTGNLTSNTYDINVSHDPAKVTGQPRTIFVQLPTPHVKTINADGTPKSGYWALQPDPAQDPTGGGRTGRLRALPQQNLIPPNSGTGEELTGMPLAADWAATEFDDTSLFRLDAPMVYSNDIPLTFAPVFTQTQFNPVLFGNSQLSPPNPIHNLIDQIVIDDRADGTIRLGATSQAIEFLLFELFFYTSPRWAYVDKTSFLTFPPFLAPAPLPIFTPPPSMLARLQFRYFPQSKSLTPPTLDESEVELFQSCSYNGDANVFNRDIANLAALASTTTKANQAAAVKLGPNTQVTLYSEPNFAGASQVISADTDCLPAGTSIGSLQVRSLVSSFSVSAGCSGCQLQGINLNNSVLDGATLSGTDLSNANLTSASLVDAVLEDVNLSKATISQAHLDQADMKGTTWSGVDLKTAASFTKVILDRASGFGAADLEGVDLSGASLREIDFNFTNLTNAKLPHADLTGANLVQTILTGADLTDSAILQKADLSFATLTGAHMQGADLTNASFMATSAGADFTGAHLDGSWFPLTDFSRATLDGATMNGGQFGLTVLAGATVNGTTFAGANIGDADYTLDQLRVANLNQAIFDKQTFGYMDLSGINFSGASFQGTTFTNITCGATNFTNANLTGATFQQAPGSPGLSGCNFDLATLNKTSFGTGIASIGITLGSSTFNSAQMQGAQLVGADATGTDLTRVNLTGANLQGAILNKPLSFKNAILDGALGLAGGNLSGAPLSTVSLRNTNLSQTNLVQADLTHSHLEGADLSYAQLQGAQLDYANLTGATLYHAFLSNDTQGQVNSAATATYAHFKNVNLSYAVLSGVDFSYANFYGTNPAGQSTCATTGNGNYQGFTQGCAAAHGATMSDTRFADAFLAGVDFTEAEIRGTDFSRAILIGANLGTTLETNTASGGTTTLLRSFLQGVNLGQATLNDAVGAAGAFADFSSGGNIVDVYLSGTNHNQFACFPGCTPRTGADVCVQAYYLLPTTVPTKNSANLTPCPDGSTGPCGDAGTAQWRSSLLKSPTAGVPLFWYDDPAQAPPTFLPAWQYPKSGQKQIPTCNGGTPLTNW